jgi:hypothetical protein
MADSPAVMMYALPPEELWPAIGVVAIRHGQMDDALRMTIKTVLGIGHAEARRALGRQTGAVLRKRLLKLARRRLGDGPALVRLEALVERSWAATEKRNDLLHTIWAKVLDGPDVRLSGSGDHAEIPSVEQLEQLAAELLSIANDLNEARLDGFLKEAIEARPAAGR